MIHNNKSCLSFLDEQLIPISLILWQDVFDEFEHEVMCTVCMSGLSEPPNEIVLCDCCNSGYHQASGFIKTTLWLHNWDCLPEIGGMTETKTFCHISLLKVNELNIQTPLIIFHSMLIYWTLCFKKNSDVSQARNNQ